MSDPTNDFIDILPNYGFIYVGSFDLDTRLGNYFVADLTKKANSDSNPNPNKSFWGKIGSMESIKSVKSHESAEPIIFKDILITYSLFKHPKLQFLVLIGHMTRFLDSFESEIWWVDVVVTTKSEIINLRQYPDFNQTLQLDFINGDQILSPNSKDKKISVVMSYKIFHNQSTNRKLCQIIGSELSSKVNSWGKMLEKGPMEISAKSFLHHAYTYLDEFSIGHFLDWLNYIKDSKKYIRKVEIIEIDDGIGNGIEIGNGNGDVNKSPIQRIEGKKSFFNRLFNWN